ncbi:pyridoxal phosphate-dependent aminotransferase [Clostridium vincentii]|uniref:Aminotransferase n=1 Tax=Clostridium vincentii TaxID=52704 RepID=A0A2T0BC83_9CLOT|nr:aminotransferase class I/II-fold pyridoxal phosphate-dependent enzyme [Clostridium vincentii]PRR81443.1 putative N-acetyl-LL-diaminopimelate aminotransferase [Clostridium vincentii]
MILEDMIKKDVKNMPPSGIRKYFSLINEMEDAISLGIGEPDFVTPWNICEAGIYSLEQGETHYSSNAGYLALRKEISKYLARRFQLNYDPIEEIIVTVGGSEGIDIALRSLVGPGDEVIIPEPSFVAYKGCTTFTGATPKIIKLKAENDFKLTVQQLEDAITDKTKVLIMPFPNNPTGAIMTREEYEPIVKLIKDKNIIIISDEIYAELTYDENHVSIASFPEVRDQTIVINGFSKSYAMTGWRLGYACGHSTLISQMKKIHQYSIMSSPTTAQHAALEALKNGDDSLSLMVAEYNRRRRVLVDGFRKLGLHCFEPLGAFYVFPCIESTGLTSEEFCEELLKSERVLTIPGNSFGECGEGFIRACYAASMEDIIEALARIENFLESKKSL